MKGNIRDINSFRFRLINPRFDRKFVENVRRAAAANSGRATAVIHKDYLKQDRALFNHIKDWVMQFEGEYPEIPFVNTDYQSFSKRLDRALTKGTEPTFLFCEAHTIEATWQQIRSMNSARTFILVETYSGVPCPNLDLTWMADHVPMPASLKPWFVKQLEKYPKHEWKVFAGIARYLGVRSVGLAGEIGDRCVMGAKKGLSRHIPVKMLGGLTYPDSTYVDAQVMVHLKPSYRWG